MNRNPILFRCDGTSAQGYENFYQCLTYAAALQRRRRGTYFHTQIQPVTLASAVQKAGNEWIPTDHPIGSDEDLRQTLAEIRRLQAAAVIVSDPNLSADYLRTIADTGALLVSVDAQAATPFPGGLLVNPLLAPTQDAYQYDPGTHLLLGSRYALVRPMIRRLRPMRAQEPPAPFRAMIALGDDDFRDQVMLRTVQLLAITRVEKVDVVVRPQHPALMDLLGMVEENPDRLSVVTEPSEISVRLSRCHFALSSGDGWSLELACVGIPQLILVQSPAHAMNAQRLDDEGAATNLGDCDSVSEIALRQAIQELLSDQRERAGMSRCGRKLIDGRGPDRLVNALEVLLHPSQAGEMRVAA